MITPLKSGTVNIYSVSLVVVQYYTRAGCDFLLPHDHCFSDVQYLITKC